MYEEAIEAGASPDQARDAMVAGMVIGTSEAVPTGRAFNRTKLAMRLGKLADDASRGGFTRAMMRVGVDALKGAAEEGTQEIIQQGLQNAAVRNIYDENRDVFDGLMASGEGGAFAGLVMNTLLSSVGVATGRSSRGQDVPVPDVESGDLEGLRESLAGGAAADSVTADEQAESGKTSEADSVVVQDSVPNSTDTIDPDRSSADSVDDMELRPPLRGGMAEPQGRLGAVEGDLGLGDGGVKSNEQQGIGTEVDSRLGKNAGVGVDRSGKSVAGNEVDLEQREVVAGRQQVRQGDATRRSTDQNNIESESGVVGGSGSARQSLGGSDVAQGQDRTQPADEPYRGDRTILASPDGSRSSDQHGSLAADVSDSLDQGVTDRVTPKYNIPEDAPRRVAQAQADIRRRTPDKEAVLEIVDDPSDDTLVAVEMAAEFGDYPVVVVKRTDRIGQDGPSVTPAMFNGSIILEEGNSEQQARSLVAHEILGHALAKRGVAATQKERRSERWQEMQHTINQEAPGLLRKCVVSPD